MPPARSAPSPSLIDFSSGAAGEPAPTSGAGSFWDSFAPIVSPSPNPQPSGGADDSFWGAFSPSDQRDPNAPPPPPPQPAPPAVFQSSGLVFESVDSIGSAPWEVPATNATSADTAAEDSTAAGATRSADAAGSFWASFDASPLLPMATPSAAQSTPQPSQPIAPRAFACTPSDAFARASEGLFPPPLAPAAADGVTPSAATRTSSVFDWGAPLAEPAATTAAADATNAADTTAAGTAASVFSEIDELFSGMCPTEQGAVSGGKIGANVGGARSPPISPPGLSPHANGGSHVAGSFWDKFG